MERPAGGEADQRGAAAGGGAVVPGAADGKLQVWVFIMFGWLWRVTGADLLREKNHYWFVVRENYCYPERKLPKSDPELSDHYFE